MKGCLYYVRGECFEQLLAVSLFSLRQFFYGYVTVCADNPRSPFLGHVCKLLNAEIIPARFHDDPLVAKILSLEASPYTHTMFLDADTLVLSSLDPYFQFLDGYDFVFTRFRHWTSHHPLIQKRLLSLTAVFPLTQLSEAIAWGPAINLGTFAFSRNLDLTHWTRATIAASEQGIFLPDEITAQALLPKLHSFVAEQIWGLSGKLPVVLPGTRIIHFHGKSYLAPNPLSTMWTETASRAASHIDRPL